MKKFISLLVVCLLSITLFAKTNDAEIVKEASGNFVDAVSTVHQDVNTVVGTVYSDAKSVTTTLYEDGKDFAKDLYPEVKAAVISIAKGLGVAAEHLYTVLVKKYVVEGLVQLIPFIIGLILVIVGWIKTEKYFKTAEKIKWQCLYPISLLVVGAITLSCVDYNTMFMGIINPEYGAINYILEYAKEMIK